MSYRNQTADDAIKALLDPALVKRLDKLFFPKSIAVIGASDIPGKWGFLLISNIIGGGFKGQLYPINPKKDSLMGIKSYKSLADIPGEVDMAVMTIPAKAVPDAMRECVAKRVEAVTVITSGFREVDEEGAELEREITKIANEGGISFIGPNTMGVGSMYNDMVAIGSPVFPDKGGVAIISQSGNVGIQFMMWGAARNIGVSFFAGIGNEAQLKSSDFLAYFGMRDEVKSVAMYLEGINNGREFMDVARAVTAKKPVLAMKTGRSATGSAAAASHSGSMAGAYATYSAMFKQVGIMHATNPSEMISVAAAAATVPIPKSNRTAIMTFGGGWGIIAADECDVAGLTMPKLPQYLIDEIDKILPPFWNRSNPVDLVAEGEPDKVLKIMQLLADWEEVDSIIALGVVGRLSFIENFVECQRKVDNTPINVELKAELMSDYVRRENKILTEIAAIQNKTGKPIINVTLGSGDNKSIFETANGNVMVAASPDDAAHIISQLAGYHKYLQSTK
ncbi:MAG: succinyl-CoA synthetase subunit alpha [Deltaproteobacteria bacterium ADurb.Bin510]|nr:MAG: succinyl-CoA synthetase subunit alpha [Deltaproteobacteria bacterium ADurb.Bin510]